MSTERRLRLIEVTIATGMSASFYKISFHLRISGMPFPSEPFKGYFSNLWPASLSGPRTAVSTERRIGDAF